MMMGDICVQHLPAHLHFVVGKPLELERPMEQKYLKYNFYNILLTLFVSILNVINFVI